MNAQEARSLTFDIMQEKSKKQYEFIQTGIENACKKGAFSYTLYESLLPAVESKLKSEKFAISKYSDQRDGVSVTISW